MVKLLSNGFENMKSEDHCMAETSPKLTDLKVPGIALCGDCVFRGNHKHTHP